MTKKCLFILLLLLLVLCGCNGKQAFSGGYAIVYKNQDAYILNNKNETLLLDDYVEIDNNFSNRILVKKEKNQKFVYGYIDNNGNEVIKTNYEKAYPFNEGYAVVIKKGKYHIINENNKIVYSFKDNMISYDSFTNGHLRVEKDGKFTFLDKNFKLSDVLFDNVENFSEGYALASIKDQNGNPNYYFINEQYQTVLSVDQLKPFDFVDSVHEGRIRVGRQDGDNYYYSFLDLNGNILVDEKGYSNYLKADNFHSGFAIIYTGEPYEMIGTSDRGRYSFQYITSDGKYPNFNYTPYIEVSSQPVNINSFRASFKRFVGDIVAIYDGNLYKIYRNNDGSLTQISLFSNNKKLSLLDKSYYREPINLLSMKYNDFYNKDNSTLLMVLKIRTNYCGIVNEFGEYITDAIYDNIIL